MLCYTGTRCTCMNIMIDPATIQQRTFSDNWYRLFPQARMSFLSRNQQCPSTWWVVIALTPATHLPHHLLTPHRRYVTLPWCRLSSPQTTITFSTSTYCVLVISLLALACCRLFLLSSSSRTHLHHLVFLTGIWRLDKYILHGSHSYSHKHDVTC